MKWGHGKPIPDASRGAGRIVAAKKSVHFPTTGETRGRHGRHGDGAKFSFGPFAYGCRCRPCGEEYPALERPNSLISVVDGLPGLQIGGISSNSQDPASWWVTFSEYEHDTQVWKTTDAEFVVSASV